MISSKRPFIINDCLPTMFSRSTTGCRSVLLNLQQENAAELKFLCVCLVFGWVLFVLSYSFCFFIFLFSWFSLLWFEVLQFICSFFCCFSILLRLFTVYID